MAPPAAPSTTRLDSLTGVRFFAAFLVFGYHGVHHANTGELDVFGAGMVGVSLFYLLSGFVMAWTARPGDTARAFYRRRFARIYPAYIVAWIIALAVSWRFGGLDVVDVLAPPTLLQAWVPLEAVYFAGSAVFWSLSCEAFFYLVFPLLWRFVSRLTSIRLVWLGVGAAVVSLGVAVAALGAGESPLTRWFLIIFPPLRLMEFVIGVVLGTLFARGWRPRVPLWAAALLSVVAVVGAAWAPYSLSRYAVTLLPFILLVCALAATDLAGRPSLLRWRPIVALGVWSYCFYLLHALVLRVVFVAAGSVGIYSTDAGSAVVWSLMGLSLVLSTVAAWLLHVGVERPLEKRLRGRRPARMDEDARAPARQRSGD